MEVDLFSWKFFVCLGGKLFMLAGLPQQWSSTILTKYRDILGNQLLGGIHVGGFASEMVVTNKVCKALSIQSSVVSLSLMFSQKRSPPIRPCKTNKALSIRASGIGRTRVWASLMAGI